MKTFHFNRFSQALKCQFLVLRKTWIRLFGIFTLVMFMGLWPTCSLPACRGTIINIC